MLYPSTCVGLRYGPGAHCLADFLGSMLTRAIPSPRRGRRTVGYRLGGWTSLPPSQPTPFNALFRQGAAVSLLRLRVAPRRGHGMLTVSAIGLALRLSLRSRLTPG